MTPPDLDPRWNWYLGSTVGNPQEPIYSAIGRRMTNRSNSRNRLSGLLGIALILGACSDSAGPTGPEAIELAVRVHLVHSNQLDALNVRLSEAEVAELMTAVNETWAQAGIVWSVENIVQDDARNESLFSRALIDPTVSLISVLTSVLTLESLRDDIWNVFMIRDFGDALGGVYLEIERVVVSAEIDPSGQRDTNGGMARILAHELGHSLGLDHVQCAAQGNLMAAGCTLGSRTFLDATQIAGVRLQAETGRPF